MIFGMIDDGMVWITPSYQIRSLKTHVKYSMRSKQKLLTSAKQEGSSKSVRKLQTKVMAFHRKSFKFNIAFLHLHKTVVSWVQASISGRKLKYDDFWLVSLGTNDDDVKMLKNQEQKNDMRIKSYEEKMLEWENICWDQLTYKQASHSSICLSLKILFRSKSEEEIGSKFYVYSWIATRILIALIKKPSFVLNLRHWHYCEFRDFAR